MKPEPRFVKTPLLKNSPVRIYPEEVLCGFFFLLLLFLAYHFEADIKGPTVMVNAVINVFLIIIVLAVLTGTRFGSLFKIVRNWAFIILILLAYENLGNLVRFVNPHDADPVLSKIDTAMFFGTNPTLYLEKWIHPWLSEVMHMFYVNYYPFLPIIGFALYITKDFRAYRDAMVSVCLGFYLGYIGYILVPTVGPRYYMADQFTLSVKGTTMLSGMVYDTLNALQSTRRDCFPSLHTAITVIVTTYAFKYRRWLFWFMLPFCTGIICATMYLRYHYVIDVIAGLALAAFCVWAGPKVNVFWYKHVTGDRIADDYPDRFPLAEMVLSLTRRLTRRSK